MRPLLSSYNVVIWLAHHLRGCRRYQLAALTPEPTQRRARLDNERGRQTVNWKAATFRLALLNHWKRQGVGLPDNYRQLWNPPTNWTARTLKERTPLHVWEVDALRAGLVAEACKKFKNATSPLIRWMIRDELAAKVTELYRRPVF